MDAVASEQPDAPVRELDDAMRVELHALMRESAAALLFAKAQQWKTVAATLLVFVSFVAFAGFISRDPDILDVLGVASFLVTPAAISILLIYQVWQHTEKQKMRAVADCFSPLFREIRAIKSRGEANAHRYLLLFFMAAAIVGAHGVSYVLLSTVY